MDEQHEQIVRDAWREARDDDTIRRFDDLVHALLALVPDATIERAEAVAGAALALWRDGRAGK